ncbi:hypothetical protein CBR_g18956 [Chara braunii]|uniref:CCHC-type domain-containing protein n=1 Tax=Chara braunii TaxID=69332 RepID=A0A388KWW7_CHABU|nr:hypothetical protein CBR_g18956 [Chara braunii]|eukprot:GBG74545.1 hypothetical protein CBR_g18956 [Chara braunii]
MAGVPVNQGCFTCGSIHHWNRDCPRRSYTFQPPATGANAIPTSTPLLPAPSTAPAPAVPTAAATAPAINPSVGYQQRPRVNWWKENQERLDRVYNKFVEDADKERKRQEQEEKDRVRQEEETKRSEWKKEREQLEAEMSARLDKRFEELGLKKNAAQAATIQTDEVARLKRENEELLRKINGTINSYGRGDEMARLKRENDELRKRLNGEGPSQRDGDCISRLQKEICELHMQVGSKQVDNDEIYVLKQEMGELKQSTYMKTNFEQEIAGLRKEVDSLRRTNEKTKEETKQWKNEALRSGNKRGSLAVGTPGTSERGNPKPRWIESMKDDSKWREEYKKLQGLHRLANVEAELLKEKRAAAEAKRMEAEKQVKNLKEKMSRLKAAETGNEEEGGGTNLKDRLEAVALGSARRGRTATPVRGSTKEDQTTNEVNDRFQFIEERKKQLRNLKKSGLEPLCKEAGIRTGEVEQMVCELAEYRAEQAFGATRGKDPSSKGKQSVYEVEDDTEQRETNTSEECDDKSVEL